jgi:hypothetical protein
MLTYPSASATTLQLSIIGLQSCVLATRAASRGIGRNDLLVGRTASWLTIVLEARLPVQRAAVNSLRDKPLRQRSNVPRVRAAIA